MIQLHHSPSSASMVPHILLEELGLPYERVLVDRTQNAQKTTAFLKLNPNGLIPVLTDGDLVLYETAAICLHLCDTHPEAGLAPGLGTAERAHFYKWLMWLTNTLQSTLMVYFHPDRWVNAGNASGMAQVKIHAEARTRILLDQLDTELARHAGPWFMGASYTALDPYVFTLCRWTRHFASTPARDRPHLGPYLQRVLERPAVQRALANEGLSPPFV
ncbi:glutathione S-transferase family protein [Hydrogenophaga taeniospiralis]|uniref:glutathione S-transferase family protein n=1 Tax=Hydrogenophaga taeniospiralis TaxID=65656 RepID=UPI001CFBBFC1|nr:glutathione S-transferase family protein [Hydrogenophaga taeniospiralis]MCB4363134.1 glutathione S-transferase family protein [Hydrogenophaga taeniospiralis]